MRKEDLKVTTFIERKGYVFISYSSADGDRVFNDFVLPLQEQYGLRVFCDSDFKNRATQNWTTQMKENLESAEACILFISDTYVSSYACLLETLIASYYKKPIIKIKLQEPKEFMDTNLREISESTKKEFIKIGKQLENARMGDAHNCYLDIESYIEEGRLSKYSVSKVFCKYLKDIKGTFLKAEDGLEAIKNSIESVQKNGVFDEIVSVQTQVIVEPVKDDIPVEDKSDKDDEIVRQDTTDENVEAETKKSSYKGKTATVTGDITYKIYGTEYTDNQSDMMINVFAKVLLKHPDMIPAIIDMPGMNCLSATDYTKTKNRGEGMPSYFRTGQYLPIGSGISVGTSYSIQDKVKKIAILLAHCNESKEVFEPCDQVVKELYDKYYGIGGTATKRGKSSEEQYVIYGKEYTGNQSKMMIDTLKAIMERHFDKRNELASLLSIKLADRSELKEVSYFNAGASFEYEGITYSIGTAFGRGEKLVQIKKAIQICNENIDNFVIEGLEEETVKEKALSKRNKPSRDFLNS